MRLTRRNAAAAIAWAFLAFLAPTSAVAADHSPSFTGTAVGRISPDKDLIAATASTDEGRASSNGSSPVSGGLLGTSGPSQELLWIGLTLLGAGSATIYTVRRRNANA